MLQLSAYWSEGGRISCVLIGHSVLSFTVGYTQRWCSATAVLHLVHRYFSRTLGSDHKQMHLQITMTVYVRVNTQILISASHAWPISVDWRHTVIRCRDSRILPEHYKAKLTSQMHKPLTGAMDAGA
jgi:hypothetical protein